jgi:hypothetical protein
VGNQPLALIFRVCPTLGPMPRARRLWRSGTKRHKAAHPMGSILTNAMPQYVVCPGNVWPAGQHPCAGAKRHKAALSGTVTVVLSAACPARLSSSKSHAAFRFPRFNAACLNPIRMSKNVPAQPQRLASARSLPSMGLPPAHQRQDTSTTFAPVKSAPVLAGHILNSRCSGDSSVGGSYGFGRRALREGPARQTIPPTISADGRISRCQ